MKANLRPPAHSSSTRSIRGSAMLPDSLQRLHCCFILGLLETFIGTVQGHESGCKTKREAVSFHLLMFVKQNKKKHISFHSFFAYVTPYSFLFCLLTWHGFYWLTNFTVNTHGFCSSLMFPLSSAQHTRPKYEDFIGQKNR